jgi:hypothetical protein
MRGAPLADNGVPGNQVFSLDGGPPVVLGGGTQVKWAPNGGSVSIFSNYGIVPARRSYLVRLPRGHALPRIPAGGFHSEEEIARLPGARRIDWWTVVPGPVPDMYAFYRGVTQRNLFRIPIR